MSPTVSSAAAGMRPLRVGFLPLTDAAPLIVADNRGIFTRHGLRVKLRREVGWATIRDKLFHGELDAAHAPAPLLWAAQFGQGGAAFPVCTAFVLNLNGNAITLSAALRAAGVTDAASLRTEALRRRGERRLTFGVVHPFSSHHLLLRAWLRAGRMEPDRDVRIAVVPPAQMFRNLVAGTIDGYCVGEPWNSVAVAAQEGWCPAWSAALSPGHVEKVLMVRESFAEKRAGEHLALVGALAEAAAWCDEPEHRGALATLLAARAYLNVPVTAIAPALQGRFDCGHGRVEAVPDFIVFSRNDANRPAPAHAAAIQKNLIAAGLVPRSAAGVHLPPRLFREDLYSAAIAAGAGGAGPRPLFRCRRGREDNPRLMPLSPLRHGAAMALACGLAASFAFGEGPYRNRDNPDPRDLMEGTYPVPYQKPTVAEITADLVRVRTYLETAMPGRLVDGRTHEAITDLASPVATAVADKGDGNAFGPFSYEVGVLHSGMLSAAQATGDRRFADFTAKQFQFLSDSLPYFRAQEAKFGMGGNSGRTLLAPGALDDCGAMTTALIQARLAGVGPDLLPQINFWADFIAHKQFRLPDGSFARHRPMAVSMWADDFYMGIPALAEMGKLTGDRVWYDDAVRATLAMSAHLFRPQTGLFSHGWNANSSEVPDFYWGRANAWITLTMSDLLDVLPADHPGRAAVLQYFRTQVRAVASLQAGNGRWHQLLDRNDSYLETSASAIFTYCIAHAINQGWVAPTTYGDIAQVGWQGVATQINAKGQVENTCVGTTFAGDVVYYYNRPVSVYAVHGYGPVLLAGSEMIRLLQNPAINIKLANRVYLYSLKANP